MSEENKTVELMDEELHIVTGGEASNSISYGPYSVRENGVYVDGDNYYFVVGKYNNTEQYVSILRRFVVCNQFSRNTNSDFKLITDLCNLTCLGTTDQNTFVSAFSPADLKL